MLTLMNKKIRFGRFLFLFSGIIMLTALIWFAQNLIHREVDAITQDGATVTVERGIEIHYGVSETQPTHYYFVTNPENERFTAYCANPDKDSPTPTTAQFIARQQTSATVNNYDRIKLIIYISTIHNNVNDGLMDILFQDIQTTPDNINDQRFAYTHAVIGYLFEGCTSGICPIEGQLMPEIASIPDQLQNLIDTDSVAWLNAQNYVLYGLEETQLGSRQNILWIERESPTLGSLTIKKCDGSNTSQCLGPQGGNSFAGITFTVYNNSGSAILYNNQVIEAYNASASDNSRAIVATGRAQSDGTVKFGNASSLTNLPLVRYLVVEGGTSNAYNLTASSQTPTLDINNQNVTLYFYNPIKTGGINIVKTDAETGTCSSLGKANLAGAEFKVYNKTGGTIYYDGNQVANNGLVATLTLSASCRASISGLPYGNYEITETSAGEGYLLPDEPTRPFTIDDGTSQQPLTLTFENQVIRGNVRFIKQDQNGAAMANIPFEIKSENTGESHIVVTNEDGMVNTSAIPHSRNTNGYDGLPLDNITYSGYGTWFYGDGNSSGRRIDNNLGALPYDDYTITELRCDANQFCRGVDSGSQVKTFSVEAEETMVFFEPWKNDCPEFSIETVAVDGADGDKEIVVGEDAKIIDTISYCLAENQEFTIKGVLMDKKTKEPLLIDGKPMEQTVTMTISGRACGKEEMVFEFDTTGLENTSIVVFSYVYHGNDLILEHADFENEDQAVHIIPKTPDTGLFAKQSGVSGGSGSILPLGISVTAISLVVYFGTRVRSRRNFMRRSR